ncbi:MAG: metalloregulator ArsR/SmtB family transcription factor [Opitutales bacterium]|nr:metalloregulator ArsR/SmtB family transcription factor [Opitutales bacterium]
MNEAEAALFGKAVGDVTRQKILRFCSEKRRCVNDIAEHTGVKQPTATHHMQILTEAGLVIREVEGKQAFYLLNQQKFISCCGQLMVQLAPENKATKAVCQCCI